MALICLIQLILVSAHNPIISAIQDSNISISGIQLAYAPFFENIISPLLNGFVIWFYTVAPFSDYAVASNFPSDDNLSMLADFQMWQMFFEPFCPLFTIFEITLDAFANNLSEKGTTTFFAILYFCILGGPLMEFASILMYFYNYSLLLLPAIIEIIFSICEFFFPVDYSTWTTSNLSQLYGFVRSLVQFFVVKFLVIISFVVIIRSGTPRYRFDYLTKLGWLKFLGFTLAVLIVIIILFFIW